MSKESKRNYTVQLPIDLIEQANHIKKLTGLSLASLVKAGLQTELAKQQQHINTSVMDKETLDALRDYELETGTPLPESTKKAVKHWLRLQALNGD